jgi:hypothetical protein
MVAATALTAISHVKLPDGPAQAFSDPRGFFLSCGHPQIRHLLRHPLVFLMSGMSQMHPIPEGPRWSSRFSLDSITHITIYAGERIN